MSKTLQAEFVTRLLMCGFLPDLTSKSRKFVAYTHPAFGEGRTRIFLGCNGSIRVGRTASTSRAVGWDTPQRIRYIEKIEAKYGNDLFAARA